MKPTHGNHTTQLHFRPMFGRLRFFDYKPDLYEAQSVGLSGRVMGSVLFTMAIEV